MSERRQQTLRRAVLALFAIGAGGTLGDLVLIGHYEDGWQVAPLVLLGGSLVMAAAVALTGAPGSVRGFQIAAIVLIAAGGAGLWLHWRANSEFEREISPTLSGAAFIWKAMRGAAPPSAAPGTLVHLGLLGLAYVWRHPAFDKGESS